MDEKIRVGFALCGSFCTFSAVLPVLKQLVEKGYDVQPIMSDTAYETDTRFGNAEDFNKTIKDICGKDIIHTIKAAEPIGPKKMLDILVVAPCTGNTLAKLAAGIADTSVTLAAKAHMRNGKNIVVAVSSNDALAANAKNIGMLLNSKHYYLVPMKQDDPENKPRSVVADMKMIIPTLEAALENRQIQPIFI
ncbi:MAG: dipicolinate synthase subunit B [Bacillota bacterium]|nr:dipicolinate synthase subunit B [Bacillota bacterium]